MPETAAWIVVALFAVLVAAAVPALWQLSRTLAVAERTIEATARRAERTLEDLGRTLERIDRLAAGLETGTRQAASLFAAVGEVGDALVKLKSSLGVVATIGASVGPVLVAAIRAALGGSGGSEIVPAETEAASEARPREASDSTRPEPMEVEP